MSTISDLLSTNVLSGLTQISLVDMAICLGLSFVIGLFILFIYKKSFSGVMYSSGFAISLIAMAMITTMVIMAIGSNLILSLGMVGALSIVRFRSAVKDPMDIAYLFWAIAVGVVLGAKLIPLAIFGSIIIGIILYLFSIKRPSHKPYILVVNAVDDSVEPEVSRILKESVKKHIVRSKTVSKNGIEMTVEVRLSNQESNFVNKVSELPGVSNAVLVSYNGEYMT